MANEREEASPDTTPQQGEGAAVLVPTAAPSAPPHGSSWLWEKVKRHKVVEWTLAYAAFAFAFLHAAALLTDALEWPHALLRTVTLLLLIGLPIAPILAWYHGVRALRRVSGAELILIALLLVIGGGLLRLYPRATPERPVTASATSTAAATTTGNEASAAFAPPAHSVAVLPFTNLSGDPKQEYFSDGMSEELINALAHIDALRVIARTSSFSFKGQNVDIGTIARKLNVAAILEGSVRRSGNTVRITAQLINTVNGFHIWSDDYDRNLKNVLELQSDIATTVARQLQVKLVGNEAVKIELGGTRDPQAYDAYLRARRLDVYGSQRSVESDARQASSEIDRAIALDPTYAAAYALRARILTILYLSSSDTTLRAARRGEALKNAEHAVVLAPDLAESQLQLGFVKAVGFLDFQAAAPAYARAVILAPGNADVQRNVAIYWNILAHFDVAESAARKGIELDPLDYRPRINLVDVLKSARRYQEALSALQQAESIQGPTRESTSYAADIYLAMGQPKKAEEICRQPTKMDEDSRHICLALAYHALGNASEARDELKQSIAAGGDADAFAYAGIEAQLGDRKEAIRWLLVAEQLHDGSFQGLRSDWALDPIRDEPDFKALERRLNFPP